MRITPVARRAHPAPTLPGRSRRSAKRGPRGYAGAMIILGIADNHDAGAAIVADGRLVSAVNQERVDRVKLSGAFPWGAIDAALDVAGLRPRDVTRIVVGTAFTPSAALRAAPALHHEARANAQFSPLLHSYIVYQSALRATGLHEIEVDACRALLSRRLRAGRPFGASRLEMMDHHRAHAEAAYRTQPADRCLVLTVDAMGDGTTATAHLGHGGQLDLLWRQSGRASINTFYSRVTEKLGFTAIRHEGKVTGLAAYAPAPPALLAAFQARVAFRNGRFTTEPLGRPAHPDDAFWSVLGRYSREEVAAAAQATLEAAILPFVRHWVQRTGCRTLAVAGGAFANVKLNQAIAALPEVESLWVCPHMGDGGLAVGAALGGAGAAPQALPSAFLGPDIAPLDAHKALSRAGLAPVDHASQTAPDGTPGDLLRAAEVLAAGQVLAIARGRMEWGPRALGHRSVLARPHDPSITPHLNERLRRSEFMPFAPVVRQEDANRWFAAPPAVAPCLPFMTACVDTTPAFRDAAPAAVHVDGTARPQLVRADTAPDVHALLGQLAARGLPPILLNTSFNLHEEPIVHTADDAVRAFRQARLDALWLGPTVATAT